MNQIRRYVSYLQRGGEVFGPPDDEPPKVDGFRVQMYDAETPWMLLETGRATDHEDDEEWLLCVWGAVYVKDEDASD